MIKRKILVFLWVLTFSTVVLSEAVDPIEGGEIPTQNSERPICKKADTLDAVLLVGFGAEYCVCDELIGGKMPHKVHNHFINPEVSNKIDCENYPNKPHYQRPPYNSPYTPIIKKTGHPLDGQPYAVHQVTCEWKELERFDAHYDSDANNVSWLVKRGVDDKLDLLRIGVHHNDCGPRECDFEDSGECCVSKWGERKYSKDVEFDSQGKPIGFWIMASQGYECLCASEPLPAPPTIGPANDPDPGPWHYPRN